MRNWQLAIAGAAVAALVTGCGSDEPDGDSDSTSEPTTTSSSKPTDAPPTPNLPTFALGKKHTSVPLHTDIRVVEVEAVDLGSLGGPGEQESVEALVETCVADDAPEPWKMDVSQFVAVTESGEVIAVTTQISGVREPSYPKKGQLKPGRCREGWAQIVMDEGVASTVTSIQWQPEPGVSRAAWTIKKPLTLGTPDE